MSKSESLYASTISARYWKDGSEILIEQIGQNTRILTPVEAVRLQGYYIKGNGWETPSAEHPDKIELKVIVPPKEAYHQLFVQLFEITQNAIHSCCY